MAEARRKQLAPVLRVVDSAPRVSHDTVRCLEELLRQAKAGDAIGIAYCVMHRGRKYSIHACGDASRNPTFALGMAHMLADDLTDRVRGLRQ